MPALLRAFGVTATVTRPAPDDTPIDTEAIWVPLDTAEVPEGSPWMREEEMRCLAFDRDAVPTLPIGTSILAPERRGGPVKEWVVDAAGNNHAIDIDQLKVLVREVTT